jgi:ATP-binding cassette subfamily F protein uup
MEVLEESLLEFPGAVVLVTHDRYLLNRVCDVVLGFDGQGRVTAFADYEQWHRHLFDREKTAAKATAAPKQKQRQSKVGRLSYLDQREYDRMEETILAAEEKEGEIVRIMSNPDNASDSALLKESWQNLEEIREKIKQLYARWDELETKKNSGD